MGRTDRTQRAGLRYLNPDATERDIQGIVGNHGDILDRAYLRANAAALGVLDLLGRALDARSTRQ